MDYYVGRYKATLDDKNRVTIPAEFEFDRGEDVVFMEQRYLGLRCHCYDLEHFKTSSKSFVPERYEGFYRLHVDNTGRINLNSHSNLKKDILILGRGDHFVIKSNESTLDEMIRFFKLLIRK